MLTNHVIHAMGHELKMKPFSWLESFSQLQGYSMFYNLK